jgi:hypothetical protein
VFDTKVPLFYDEIELRRKGHCGSRHCHPAGGAMTSVGVFSSRARLFTEWSTIQPFAVTF